MDIELENMVLVDGMTVKAGEYGDLPYFIKNFAQSIADDRGKPVKVTVRAYGTLEFKPKAGKGGEEL